MHPPTTTGPDPAGPGGPIDLGAGHPDPTLLPVAPLAGAASKVLVEHHADLLNYGPERGDERLRRLLAEFLGRQTLTPCDPQRLLVTAGASQALDLLCTLLTVPGDTVIVTDPTYHLALRTFADHGLRVSVVPYAEAGIDLRALEATLELERARLLYLMPSFANPNGVTLGHGQREAVLDMAAEAEGLWTIADDVYAPLAFGGPTGGRFGVGRRRVASLGSFSKILAPGLRLGWIEGPPDLLARVESSGLLQSGGGLNPLPGSLVVEMLTDGACDAHLGLLRQAYRERAWALADELQTALPQARLAPPEGGFFVWAELPEVDTVALLDVARRSGVSYQPGSRFSSVGAFRSHVRLSFSRYEPNVLRLAAARLGEAVQSLRHHTESRSDRLGA